VIVISDAGPLAALYFARAVDVFPGLFGRITIPGAVADECVHKGMPVHGMPWIDIRTVATISSGSTLANARR